MMTASCSRSRSATCSTATREREWRTEEWAAEDGRRDHGAALRDEIKYRVVDDVAKYFGEAKEKGEKVGWQRSAALVTVNGVRVTVEDGTWGLVRASSKKPEPAVVVESPVSEARMREMFKAVDAVPRTHPEVGEDNQTI